MSFIFFLTTGEFLQYLKPGGSAGGGPAGQPQEAPAADERAGLLALKPHGHGHGPGPFSPSKRPSIFDDHPLTRRLSLIVPKDEADGVCCEMESRGDHPIGHPHHHHHHSHNQQQAVNGTGEGGGAEGGAYATII